MPEQLFTNNATTLLDADIGIGATALAVTGGDGALFPLPTAGDWFYATIQSGALLEIVQVTTRVTDDFTVIVRAQEGTSAIAWTAGAVIELRLTKAWLDSVRTTDTDPALGDVVGPASAVDNRVAFFDGVSGVLLKDSGLTLSGSNTGDQTLPIDSTIVVTDNTGNDADENAHGWTPKGENTTTKFLRDDVTWAVPPSNTGLPELIINGEMNLWQRGTTFTGLVSGYHADRFEHIEVSDGVVDVAQVALGDTDIFNAVGQLINYGIRYTVGTLDASIGAGETVFLSHKVEGYRAVPYMHNVFTMSFYVRSSITGTFGFACRNEGPASVTDKSFVKEFTIDVADTWERKTITVPVQDRTGTWNYTDGVGLQFTWCLMSGTTFGSATDDVWNTSNEVTTTNQTNWMEFAADTFDLAAVQVDLGPDAQPFRGTPYDQDLAAAMRYYQKSYDHDDAPGATVTQGEVSFRCIGAAHVEPLEFPVPFRIPPTVTAHNPNNTGNDWRDEDATADVAVTFNVTGEKRTVVGVTSTDTNQVSGHWEATAEL